MTESSEAKSPVDQSLIRELAALLKETELSEIEIEQNGLRLRVARQFGTIAAPAPAPFAPSGSSPVSITAHDPAKHPGAVTSPMVGTIYLAAEPNTPPFIKIGDTVIEGQTLVIVEAMKTMNHIPAPRGGKITQILVQNAQPVEYGEPLVVIE